MYKILLSKKKRKPRLASMLSQTPSVQSHVRPAAYQLSVYQKVNRFMDKFFGVTLPNDPTTASVSAPSMADTSIPSNPSNSEKTELTKAEKRTNREIFLTLMSMMLAVGGWVHPILNPLSVITLLIYTFAFYKASLREIFQERRITLNLIDSIILTGAMTGGFYFMGALGGFLASVGRRLLANTEDNSRKKLINVFGEQPTTVWRLVDELEIETPLEELQKDDIVVVSAGQTIPIDGVIVSGVASIDQHRLTGEAQPAEKSIGDHVFAATVVLSSQIHIQVEKTGTETQVAKVGDILSQTADFKLSVQSRGEVLANQCVGPTLAMGGLALPFLGLSGAMATIYCPIGWFIRLSAPISLLNFLYILSENDVLIKDARSLELLTSIDTVVFDKTGTLTSEQPQVGNIYTCMQISEDELLQLAATAEWKQTHPIAKAILTEAEKRNLDLHSLDDVHYEVGYGIRVKIQDQTIQIGSRRFMEMENIVLSSEMQNLHSNCSEQGHSLVMIAMSGQLAGAIELHATIRPEAKSVIHALKQKNKILYIISGDHEQPTQNLAKQLDIDYYFANALPSQKADLIDQLAAEGKTVCFVGDGINDSIALRKATVSISLTGATAVATDIADIVLMDGSLKRLPDLFDITQQMDTNMQNNFILAVVPGIICISGAFLFHLGMAWGITSFMTGLVVSVANAMIPRLRYARQIYSTHSNTY